MKKGDIVLVPFPFTDLQGAKNRPALVLFESELDVTACFLTTQLHWKEDTDLDLTPDELNGLKKASLVKLNKIATLDKRLLLGMLGKVGERELSEVDEKLIRLLQIKIH